MSQELVLFNSHLLGGMHSDDMRAGFFMMGQALKGADPDAELLGIDFAPSFPAAAALAIAGMLGALRLRDRETPHAESRNRRNSGSQASALLVEFSRHDASFSTLFMGVDPLACLAHTGQEGLEAEKPVMNSFQKGIVYPVFQRQIVS